MGQYSFKSHRTTLSKVGFAALPGEIVDLCKAAIIFHKHSGVFVLCDEDAFCEFRDKALEYDMNDKKLTAIKRRVYASSLQIEAADDLSPIMWILIERYVEKYADAGPLEVEMRPYNMLYFGEKSKNQFIEIEILNGES